MSTRHWLGLAVWGLLATSGGYTQAQGCAQCRDAVQATPVRQQQAYRGAIGLLAGTAVLVCTGVALALGQRR